MKTPTLWVKTVKLPRYKSLTADLGADVVIIGGGITGILSAYQIARETNKKIIILEKSGISDGATHLTAAFLTEIIDTDLSKLIKTFGITTAKDVIRSHRTAIDFIEQTIDKEGIDCDFKRCSNYIFAHTDDAFAKLLREYDAMIELGIDARLSADPLPGFKNYGYIQIMNQAKFHPLKYLRGLLNVIKRYRTQVYENTEAIKIDQKTMSVVTKSKNKVSGTWILAATYEPFRQPLGLFFKKGMYTTYVIEANIPHQAIREGIYQNTKNPYHYFRVDPGHDFDTILIGGEDHRSDVHIASEKNFEALEEYLREILEDREYSLVNRWDGPILEPSDGLAFIGPHKNPKILYAFGFSGNGMTYAGITADIFARTIKGENAESAKLYRASRLLEPKALITKAADYSREFIHGAAKNVWRK